MSNEKFCPEHTNICKTLGSISQSVENLSNITCNIDKKLNRLLTDRATNGEFRGAINVRIAEMEKQQSKIWDLWDGKISDGLIKVGLISSKWKMLLAIIGTIVTISSTAFLTAFFSYYLKG